MKLMKLFAWFGFLALIGVGMGLLSPSILKEVDRYRLTGDWHVRGTLGHMDLKWNGGFTTGALADFDGRYELLSGNRIRLFLDGGDPQTYRYYFQEVGILLEGCDGTALSYRLVPKD